MADEYRSAVSVTEMAREVGLSRSRFYQLIGSTFPEPSRDKSGRPYYTLEQQQVCLEVRHRHCGVDGQPILFYTPRKGAKTPSKPQTRPRQVPVHPYDAILAGVQALGLTTATGAQVSQFVQQLYPNGVLGSDPGEVVKAVFLAIRRQNQDDTAGR